MTVLYEQVRKILRGNPNRWALGGLSAVVGVFGQRHSCGSLVSLSLSLSLCVCVCARARGAYLRIGGSRSSLPTAPLQGYMPPTTLWESPAISDKLQVGHPYDWNRSITVATIIINSNGNIAADNCCLTNWSIKQSVEIIYSNTLTQYHSIDQLVENG